MKSQNLEELIKQIFGNEETRKRFESDPSGVMEQYDLTEKEKRAMLSTQVRLGLVTSDSQIPDSDDGPYAFWNAPIP